MGLLRRSSAINEGAQTSHLYSTHLTGRWLILARMGWLLLVTSTLVLYVCSLPAYFKLLQMPCTGEVVCSLNGTLRVTGFQVIQAAGFSPSGYATYTIALNIIIAILWSAVGLFIYRRRSDDWMALVASLTLVLYNPGQQNSSLEALALTHPIWSLPVDVITFLSEVPIIFFVLLFPDGRFVPHWTRWVVPIALVQTICIIFPPVNSPLNANNWPLALNGVMFIGLLLIVIFSQTYRYRRISNAIQHQQIKWAVFGLILYGVLLIGLSLLSLIPGLYSPGSSLEIVLNTLYPLAALPLPISIGIAVLRYRLWDIDIIINRTLVYGILTIMLALVYFVFIFTLQYLLRGIINQNNDVAIVISTLVIAAIFQPLRHRIQRVIDRRFYRSKYDTARTLEAFSAALRNEIDLNQLRNHLIDVVQETMQPAHVSLWLKPQSLVNKQPTSLTEAYDDSPQKGSNL